MTRWTSNTVARVLGAATPADCTFGSVGTDTRTLEPGALFVALVGERFDAHSFLAEAKGRGAAGAVVRRGSVVPDGLVAFEVDDTLVALGRLARARRREIVGPVVAVTGTNGKTSTKELIAGAVGSRWRVHATRGNLNNLVGVPLTILSAADETEALVVEAGASIPGEIARLRDIVEPTLGVVTNVSAGHLEGFGSVTGVLEEKVSLLDGVATAVVGTQPSELAARARAVAGRVVTAGAARDADVHPDGWSLDGDGHATIVMRGVAARVPVPGGHYVDNAMLALAVALELGIEPGAVAAAVSGLSLPPGRCQVLRHGGLTVLHDAYNANPGSVAALLQTAAAMRGSRPLVVVLGTMRELGDHSVELHAAVAARVMECQPHLVAVTGDFIAAFGRYAAVLGDRLLAEDDPVTLGRRVAQRLEGNELVLVKASRGVRLERVLPHIIPDGDAPCSTIS